MTGGRGYLALASLIVARWNPARGGDRMPHFRRGGGIRVAIAGLRGSCELVCCANGALSYRARRFGRTRALLADAGRDRTTPAMGSVMADQAETLEELAGELADGRMTSISLVERSLDRVARLDGRLNSFVAIDEQGAIAAAKESDARRKRGEAKSRLDGIPISVKDNIHVAGLPSTLGQPRARELQADE
jgi:hypothetical protein